MIYLTEGNTPLNEAYNDEIVQERNNTYQLTFRFPTSDPKWELLKEETFLTADDLHGEQDFYIFEVEKQQGYIQVYANQVISLLNNYIVSSIDVDRVSGTKVLSAFAGSITRANPFSFFSDIDDRHTLNIKDKNAMEVLAKDKHSILGQWGGDMVRNGYNLRLLKNGGSENESLFMYKKNLSSYQHKTSTKSLKTRITFKTTVKGEGEKAPDVDYVVVIDSPLLGKYSQIYEAVIEVNDQNVKDQASLIEYGKQYFRTSMCDMLEDNLEISVIGQSDVAIRMFDVVSIYHEWYGLDVRKKITKYTYSPMAKRLKSIGFGTFQSSLANAIGGIVNDAVLNESQNLHKIFEERLKKEIANADRAFDAEFAKREKDITDGIELAKAKAEEIKQELSDTINQRFDSFDNGPLKEAKRRAEEALRNAGASSLLAQEAKRIGLDSVARLEAFKSQTMSAQTALSGDFDVLKRTIANDIRPKQAQAEAEIAKQVEALNKTKNELAGVKSAQATYEETTTRRLSELTNLANGKASKSELTQTAEELASKIASVRVGGRNHYRDSEKVRTSTRFFSFPLHPYLTKENVGETWTLSFDLKINEGGEIRPLHFYHYQSNRFGLKTSADITPSKEWQRFTFTGPVIFPNDDTRYSRGEMALYDYGGNNNYSVRRIKLEKGTLATDWSPAIEDTDGKISAVESNFRQRADALDAGVRSLTEGLRTKADISSLNVTAENIRQTVKSLETSTQNKLDQKLSQAEFEVQAGSIRQEILNATKDKADKTLVVAEAGKLREEFSKIQVGGRNHYRDSEKVRTSTRFFSFPLHPYLTKENVGETWTLSFDLKINEGGEIRPLHFYHYQSNRFGLKTSADITPSKEWQRFTFTGPVIFPNDDTRYSRGEMALYDYGGNNNYSVRRIKLEKGTLATDWSPAIEDTDGLITEAKAIFERTAQGLRTDLSAIQEYVNKDGQRQEALQRYTREESAKQATAVRELVNRDFVGKSTYQEDVKGINQSIEAVKTSANKEIASQIASYRQSVDGKFTDISSQITTYKQDVGGQISGLSNRLTSSEQGTTTQISNLKTQLSANKANADSQFNNVTNQLARKVETTDFQRVKETSQLYERILGNTENGIADKVARMAMTSQLFQVEVAKNEGLKTVQSQLAGSWAVQNINSAGDIISGINLGADGRNRFIGKTFHITGETLIDNAVIKSAMVDKLKTANFESGSVTTKILDAEAVTADKVRFDDAFIGKMIANEAFIDKLTSKQIFATKVESVVSSSTFLEAYQGRIGGFTLGQFDQGGGRWISGVNQFSVGMGNGAGYGVRTAFWANWGNNWNYAGPKAWNVNTDGKMYCRNEVGFYDQVDFSNSSRANFYGNTTFSRSPVFSNGIELGEKDVFGDGWNPKGGRNAVVWWNQVGSGSVKYWMDQKSDRRLKENITDTAVKALNKINRLRMVAFDFIESKKHEEIGLIAQEVETIVPRVVSRDPENPDGYLHIDYTALVPYLIKAIQELNQKIEKMEKTIA